MRKSKVERNTKETKIKIELNIDGSGNADISTPIPFMDHMLSLLAKHSLIDLKIQVKGDIEVDEHHTTEDVGISLGEAFKKAMGKKIGIKRFASISMLMDDTLCDVAVDFSGRPFFVYNVKFKTIKSGFDYSLLEEFFRAFAFNAGLNLHINMRYGNNNHHISEAIFKGLAKVILEALVINKRIKGIPSTKGKL